jgi:AraC family transcriptional regulator
MRINHQSKDPVLRLFSGACVRRVIDRSHSVVPEHAHDWPLLSIYVIGAYRNRTEQNDTFIAGPSAVLYRAGASHHNAIAPAGFEQIEIEFDPAWLGRASIPDAPISLWVGGRAGAEACVLARLCGNAANDTELRAFIHRFVERARSETRPDPPGWVARVTQRLREDTTLGIETLAREIKRHPSWLGTAYRRATGEGLRETAARFRLERAARLLRESDASPASIAADAGFCDQSHMSRTFRRLLGRTPAAVRNDRLYFRQTIGPGDGSRLSVS